MTNRFPRFLGSLALLTVIAFFAAAPQQGAAQTPSKEDIRALQEGLAEAGFSPGRPDGIMGRQSRAAMKKFLGSQQLDPATSAAATLEALADFRARRDRQFGRFTERFMRNNGPLHDRDRTRKLIAIRLAAPTTEAPYAIFKDWDGQYLRLHADGSMRTVPYRPAFVAVRDGNPLEVLLQFINLDEEAAEPQTPETVCDAAMIRTFFEVAKGWAFAGRRGLSGSEIRMKIPSILTAGVREPSLTEQPYLWCAKWTMELAHLAEGYRLPDETAHRLAEYEVQRARALNRDLLDAARRLTVRHVREHLAEGADINTVDDKGDTVLSLAARRGDSETVELALELGASPDIRPAGGGSPLIDAVARGRDHVVRILLRAGAPTDPRDSEGRTALSWSAARDDIEVARLLLDQGADPNDRRDDGRTALIEAAQSGGARVIELLVANGADVNAVAGDGRMALHAAVAKRNRRAAEILLDAGAAANAADANGETPLQTALAAGETGLARLLVAHGARTDSAAADGTTPLIRAASLGSRELVELLLDNGADPLARAGDGRTALEHSTDYGVATLLAEATGSMDMLDAMRFVLPHRMLGGKLSLRLPPGVLGRGCPGSDGQPLTGLHGVCFDPPVHPVGDVETLSFGGKDVALAATRLQDGMLRTEAFGTLEFLLARTDRVDVYVTGAQMRQLMALAGQ